MCQTNRVRRIGFTIVELLVVISIVGLLAALLLPAIHSTRVAARRVQCQNNIRQLGLAAMNHHDAFTRFPAGFEQQTYDGAPSYRGNPLFAQLLLFLEQSQRLDGWDKSDPLTNALGEDAITAAVIPVFVCPDDYLPRNPVTWGSWTHGLSSYGGNGGTQVMPPWDATVDGIFHTTGPASEPKPNQRSVRLRDITDGASNTLLFGERNHRDANFETFVNQGVESLTTWGWWGPVAGRRSIGHLVLGSESGLNRDLPFSARNAPSSSDLYEHIRLRQTAYGSGHAGGTNFSFCGGEIRFLADSIEPDVLQALSTRNQAERAELD